MRFTPQLLPMLSIRIIKHAVVFTLPAVFFLTACQQPKQKETTQAEPTITPAITGDAQKGKQVFATCVACHGAQAEGLQAMNAPRLTGVDTWYAAGQLNNFKKGIRGAHADDKLGAQMAPMAKTLANDQQIADVLAYIKTLGHAKPTATITGDVEKGKDYYNMACSACHGTNAVGNQSLLSPKLTGIDDWYLQRQFTNFQKGIRGLHAHDKYGAQMQQIASGITDSKTVTDIIAYINSIETTP